MIAVGARGVISVTSNVIPRAVSKATDLALNGDRERARAAHLALLPVHEAMFVEANPGPVKAAMARAVCSRTWCAGRCAGERGRAGQGPAAIDAYTRAERP